jgi:hypothetical protein
MLISIPVINMKLNLSLVTQLCLCIQTIGSVSAAAAEGQL